MSKEDNMRNLADAMVQRRFILGVSQERLASMANVSSSSVKNIEKWSHTPDRKFRSTTLFAIEDALGWERYTIARIAAGFETFPTLKNNSKTEVISDKQNDSEIVTMGMIQDMIYSYVRQQAMLTTVGIRN